MKNKAKYRLLLIFIASIILIGYDKKPPKDKKDHLVYRDHKLNEKKPKTDPDKNLLLGEWSKTGTPYLIKINGILENGKLEVSYYDPEYITIVKANWMKTGTLLTIYIELQDDNYPNSSFKLNYIPERDVLVGDFFDVVHGMNYPVEFVRIK